MADALRLHSVSEQEETTASAGGDEASPKGGKSAKGDGKKPREPKPIDFGRMSAMFDRYTLIYGTNDVWDALEQDMIPVSAFRLAYSGGYAKFFLESHSRKMLPRSAVVFDPARKPDGLHINLFRGFGLTPAPGECKALLGLLRSLCGTDEVFEYVCNWIAYPLQHPGFKLRTALVFHGVQGVGKNLFWESLGLIYGDHFSVIGQQQVEAKFNEWASRKLLVIADEVLTRSELATTRGTIKALITGETIQIEPKHTAVRKEANRMNIVFFSNEAQPVPVEDGDRRFLVVRCDKKLTREEYDAVANERDNGGVRALYDWFLKRDLTGFNPFGAPPETQAKADMVELGRSSPMQFAKHWLAEAIPGLPLVPARTTDLHQAYLRWCTLVADRFPWPLERFNGEIRRASVAVDRMRVRIGLNTAQAKIALPDGLEVWETARKAPSDGTKPQSEADFYGDYAKAFADALVKFKRSDLNGVEARHADV